MNAALLAVALSAVGVDHGWQPLPEGGVEYILQIEPQIFESLRSQNDVESYLPPGLKVKKIRVTVGTAKLPKDAGRDEASKAPAESEQVADNAVDNTSDEPVPFDATADLASAKMANEKDPFSARQSDVANGQNEAQSNESDLGNPVFGAEANKREKFGDRRSLLSGDNRKSKVQERETNRPSLEGDETGKSKTGATKTSAEAEKPWLPLTVTALALCLSLAANFYLAWIARDARARYRDLLDQVQSPTAAAA